MADSSNLSPVLDTRETLDKFDLIIIELRVISQLLVRGLNLSDDLDALRSDEADALRTSNNAR